MYPARRNCRLASLTLADCTHCIFCFAGAHHAVIGTAPAIFHRVNVAMVVVPWLGDDVRPKTANPLHDRKSKRSSAQRVIARGD